VTQAARSRGFKTILGHSTINVTEQYGMIGDDLVMREAKPLERQRKIIPR